MNLTDEIKEIEVSRGTNSSTQIIKGNLEELKDYFKNNMNVGYCVDGVNIGGPEFIKFAGKYVLTTVTVDELLSVTNTLEEVNEHNSNTGLPQLNENDAMYHIHHIFESFKFSLTDPDLLNERVGLLVESGKFSEERIKETAFYNIGSSFFNKGKLASELKEKYHTMESDFKYYWNHTICQEKIFPKLEKLFE